MLFVTDLSGIVNVCIWRVFGLPVRGPYRVGIRAILTLGDLIQYRRHLGKRGILVKIYYYLNYFYLRKSKYSFHSAYLFNLFYTLPLSVTSLSKLYFYYLVSIQTCILDDVPRKAKIFVYPKKKKQLSQDINARVIHIEERRIATTPEIEVVSPSSFRMDLNEGNPRDKKALPNFNLQQRQSSKEKNT